MANSIFPLQNDIVECAKVMRNYCKTYSIPSPFPPVSMFLYEFKIKFYGTPIFFFFSFNYWFHHNNQHLLSLSPVPRPSSPAPPCPSSPCPSSLDDIIIMPVAHQPVQVSLSDVLQVKAAALDEQELWSVLCQSAEAVQDIFIKGMDGSW